jgi:zinc transport system substrate-binding protein
MKAGSYMKRLALIYAVVMLGSFLSLTAQAAERLTVYTVNYPLAYFAERIAGEHARVVLPAPRSEDPAFWMPDMKTIAEYQRADLILLNGAGYARWVSRVSLPRSRMVDTSAGFRDEYVREESAVTHSHGPAGEHAHEDTAFTTWLDPGLAAKQARAVADAMKRRRPALAGEFEKNYASLEEDLMALDREITEIVKGGEGLPLVASHPVYQYLQRRYGLNMKSVHWEPDALPGDGEWLELTRLLKKHPARWMLWEGEPMAATVERLDSLGVGSIVFDPCGNVPGKGDFLSTMRRNVESLKEAF